MSEPSFPPRDFYLNSSVPAQRWGYHTDKMKVEFPTRGQGVSTKPCVSLTGQTQCSGLRQKKNSILAGGNWEHFSKKRAFEFFPTAEGDEGERLGKVVGRSGEESHRHEAYNTRWFH